MCKQSESESHSEQENSLNQQGKQVSPLMAAVVVEAAAAEAAIQTHGKCKVKHLYREL